MERSLPDLYLACRRRRNVRKVRNNLAAEGVGDDMPFVSEALYSYRDVWVVVYVRLSVFRTLCETFPVGV